MDGVIRVEKPSKPGPWKGQKGDFRCEYNYWDRKYSPIVTIDKPKGPACYKNGNGGISGVAFKKPV